MTQVKSRRCDKAIFPSERASKKFIKRFKTSKKRMRPYLCPDCRYWHISTQTDA